MAEEMESLEFHPQQRVRQQISVPYLWELKPGTPKREWISKPTTTISVPSPAKLVVSVPFLWEEEPGKPLVQLSQQFPDSSTIYSSQMLDGLSPSRCSLNPFITEDEDYSEGFNLEGFSFHIGNDASGADPSLTNCQVASVTAPAAANLHQSLPNSFTSREKLSEDSSNRHETWYSLSETDGHSSSSSSTTQNDGGDASVLEFLFPLSSPEVAFINKVSKQDRATTEPEPVFKNNYVNKPRPLAKRTVTLGELIELSRKLSYRRKTVDVKEKNPSMELTMKSLIACFPFVISSKK
ncbi:uncharacterized protein [Typha angustifolia]|uniref:uncharacterized protein isoform X1 n=2 Tax=Typha angustifolia TaxID=59011 RepID=UPI003C2CFA3F